MSFETFVKQRRADLQRISRATHSEHSLADVINEAWLMAESLRAQKGISPDFLCGSFQNLLISHLYQHLARYTERNVRHGIRLDHAAPGEEDTASHWLMRTLVSDDGEHPLTLLEQLETSSAAEPDPVSSQAGAWLMLFRHFRNDMRAVATYLLISRSWAYRCSARAEMLVECQHALLPMGTAAADTPLPRPWRKVRLFRTPEQLLLPLDDELPLDDCRSIAASGFRGGAGARWE